MDKGLHDLLIKNLEYCKVSEVFLKFVDSPRPAVIYGAGRQARIVLDFCTMFGKEVTCLMTTKPCSRWGLLPQDMPMFQPQQFLENHMPVDYDVITAVGETVVEEVTACVKENGYPNCFVISDWNILNDKIRRLFYDCYLEYHGAKIIQRENDSAYVEVPTANGLFRTCYPSEHIFQANVLGEFNNIILPSVFDDFSLALQGAYELPEQNVTVQKGDIVFDLGANIGLFSCAAASRGCEKVYAFEPMPYVINYMLNKNAELNLSIEVIPKVVGAYCGNIPFYYNDRLQKDADTCRGSIHRNLEPLYAVMTAEQITLDSFVKERGISHVDYIKSHIEYAENDMLKGAQDTLRHFAPKLAFYSQRALGNDRYKEIESLILAANPNYKFVYKWRRVFAYVPNEKNWCR